MKDYSKFHNPYDFANPVSDKDLFVGRKDELEEIRYYLDLAKTAPRPINIALLGPRAAGKTSLLNMCHLEAKKRDLCVVRIDLDENDAKNQLNFFFKVFDGIFTAVCECGLFGGKEGTTYDIYLDLINTNEIPKDKTFCPFLFPIQYAKAMGSGNIDAQLQDANYKNDLIKIHNELAHPIILLFDEGNVLAHSRTHLEKLRNIFMNIPGYMLVFVGTPDLFPVMDAVFSPIVRQFKKINVAEFKNEEETEDCIRKPLEKIGIKPEEIFDFQTYIEVNEIHNLSGGRPYEIQLICHKLFYRIQTKQAQKMKLDLNILEDVRKELETSQDITLRPILLKIKNLNKNQLLALSFFSLCDDRATFDQLWAIEYIRRAEQKWTKNSIEKELQYFIQEKILKKRNEDIVKFLGDDFDKIYVKYFAREQNIMVNFMGVSLEILWGSRLNSFFKKWVEDLDSILGTHIGTEDTLKNIENIISEILNPEKSDDIFGQGSPLIEKLYFLMIAYRTKKTVPVIQTQLVFPWLNTQTIHFTKNSNEIKNIDVCLNKSGQLKERAKKMGGKLFVKKIKLSVIPIEILAKKIMNTTNEKLKNDFAARHAFEMVNIYFRKSDTEESLFHANLTYKYNSKPEQTLSNDLGYLYMAAGDFVRAKELLERASNSFKKSFPLAYYNLGILEAKQENFKSALDKISICIKKLKKIAKKERLVGCLFMPILVNKKIKFEEIRNKPNLLEAAIEAERVLKTLI